MKISRCLRPALLAAMALTLPLAACKKHAPEFAPETVAALQALEDADWDSLPLPEGSPQEVLKRYRATGDPNTADDKSAVTILDIACAARNRALIETLLAEGASVQPLDGYSPLHAVLMSATELTEEQETIDLLDYLATYGADLTLKDYDSVCLVACAVGNPEITEGVCLHLLDKGAPLGEDDEAAANTVMMFAARGWNEALRRALTMKAPLTCAGNTALHAAVMPNDETEHAETLQLLLDAGMDVNAANEEGKTALFMLISTLSEDVSDDRIACISLLLKHGASLTEPPVQDEDMGELTAYDFLASHTALIAELREQGHEIPDLPLCIRDDADHLRADLLRADLRLSGHPQAAEQLKPYLPLLTKVLSQHLYGEDGEMAGAAFSLLCTADKSLAEQLLPHLPLWSDYKEWEMKEGAIPAGVELLSILMAVQEDESKRLSLPKDSLLHAAAMLAEHKEEQHAIDVAELLEYAPDAQEDIDRLSEDDTLPVLQLGALTAKLHLVGLPDAKVGSLSAWLGECNVAAQPPVIAKALRLTDLETFWFGEMETHERATLVADIESLGLAEAAAIYRRALPDGLTDDELADLMAEASEYAVALELAVARLILDNAEDFRNAKK